MTGDFKVEPTNLWPILAAIQTIGDYRPILEFVGGDLRQLPDFVVRGPVNLKDI